MQLKVAKEKINKCFKMICLGVDWIEELVAHWSSSASYVSSPQFLWKLIRQKVIVFHANFFFTIRIQKAGLTKVAFGVVSKRFKKVVVKQMYFIIISFKKHNFSGHSVLLYYNDHCGYSERSKWHLSEFHLWSCRCISITIH